MTCEDCERNKQIKRSFHHKKVVTTSKPLQFLHMNLCCPMRIISFGGKKLCFVILNDFSRFTWILFLTRKSDAFDLLSRFCKRVQRECGHSIVKIKSDHDGEFENENFKTFCHFMTSMALSTRSPHQEHCNKIVLLNETIVQYKRWHALY